MVNLGEFYRFPLRRPALLMFPWWSDEVTDIRNSSGADELSPPSRQIYVVRLEVHRGQNRLQQ